MIVPDEENDPVVQELPVYLSKQLSQSLYLFQYPVRPKHLPYNSLENIGAKMKPVQQKVELEFSIDTESANYCRGRGEEIATNMNNAKSGSKAPSCFPEGIVNKQVLMSTDAATGKCRYAIGAFCNGELHLTPLKGIVQMQPELLQMSGKKLTNESGEDQEDEEEEEAKPVQMRYQARESDEAKARRLASYEFLQKQQQDEGWVQMRFHGIEDDMTNYRRPQLLASAGSDSFSQFSMSEKEYLEKMMPADTVEKMLAETARIRQGGIFSLADIKSLPLSDQITAVIGSCGAIQYSKLVSLLPKGAKTTDVINQLQQVAVLINGCWVAKSEVLFPKGKFSRNGGISSERMCKVRDYLLWKFSQNPTVTRMDIEAFGKLPKDDEAEILEKLARRGTIGGDWVFLFERDESFISKFKEVVERQALLWRVQGQVFSNVLNTNEHATSRILTISPNSKKNSVMGQKKTAGEQVKMDQGDNDVIIVSSKKRRPDNDLGNDAAAAKRGKLLSGGLPVPISNIKMEPKRDVEPVAQSGELKQEVVDFVKKLLCEMGVLWMSLLKERFDKHLLDLPAGHVLGRGGVSDHLLEQSLVEAGGEQMTANGKPVYVLPRRGDGKDSVRSAVLRQLKGKASLKIGMLRKELTDASENEDVPSDTQLREVLKEYCDTSGGTWRLRGPAKPDH